VAARVRHSTAQLDTMQRSKSLCYSLALVVACWPVSAVAGQTVFLPLAENPTDGKGPKSSDIPPSLFKPPELAVKSSVKGKGEKSPDGIYGRSPGPGEPGDKKRKCKEKAKSKKSKTPTRSPAPTSFDMKKAKKTRAPTLSPAPTSAEEPTSAPFLCTEEPTVAAEPGLPNVNAPATAPSTANSPATAPSLADDPEPLSPRLTSEPTMISVDSPTTTPAAELPDEPRAGSPTAVPTDLRQGAPSLLPSWPQTDKCDAIANGMGPTDQSSSRFLVDFVLVTTAEDTEAVLQRLETFLQTNVAPLMANCTVTIEQRRRERLRGLQELKAAVIENVVFDVTQDRNAGKYCCRLQVPASAILTDSFPDSCTVNDGSCITALAVADIYHTDGNATRFASQLLESILIFCDAIGQIMGIEQTYNPCLDLSIDRDETGDIDVTGESPDSGETEGTGSDGNGDQPDKMDDSGAVGAVRSQPTDEKSLRGGGVVGILAAGVLMTLLMIAAASRQRRRHREAQSLKHQPLEEDLEDTVYTKDWSEGSPAPPSPARDSSGDGNSTVATEQPRFATQVVYGEGEDDSEYSPQSTDVYRNLERSLQELSAHSAIESSLSIHPFSDVHKCSSATCEICEQQRRSGVQFVPAVNPIKMPYHQSEVAPQREYDLQNTVEL
jgi:hypothetical protein